MCILLTCYCYIDSRQTCCLCIKNKNSIKYIQLADILELALNIGGVYCFIRYSHTLLLPLLILTLGNFISLIFRIIGSFSLCCGRHSLKAKQDFFFTRAFGLFFQSLVFFLQIMLTVLIFDNKFSFASRSDDELIEENYDKFSHGLCVFCPPDECQE